MWVSDNAREVWEIKFIQFAECWRQIEWLSVIDGVRPCALLFVSQQEFAGLALTLREYGLKAVALSGRVQEEREKPFLLYRVAVGRSRDLRAFSKAWKAGDDDTIGLLLGYPKCCRSFFHNTFVREGRTDCTWQMGCQTSNSDAEVRNIDVKGSPELNPFWIPTGIRMVPHFPCRFNCHDAQLFAQKFIVTGTKAGYATAMKIALEILSWPVEWSCLHGIAEIRTPILKISQRTDMTIQKCAIHFLGSSYPEEGAKPLRSLLRIPSYASGSTASSFHPQVRQ